jgi:ketosteroid isomerase-like protein
MTTALHIVQQYQQSLGNGTDAWQDLLAENVEFHGPVDTVKGREANIELNTAFSPSIKDYQPLRHLDSEHLAVLEGVYTVMAPSGNTITLEIAEFYEVQDGQIHRITLYYDAEEFRREFAANNS